MDNDLQEETEKMERGRNCGRNPADCNQEWSSEHEERAGRSMACLDTIRWIGDIQRRFEGIPLGRFDVRDSTEQPHSTQFSAGTLCRSQTDKSNLSNAARFFRYF